MILVIDNYDSFTYNLVQYLGELTGHAPEVLRNDRISVHDAMWLEPSHIVISPGPCSPAQAGISEDLIYAAAPTIPILGVCLGHQAIASAFGGTIIKANALMHGKTSPINHDQKGIFKDLPQDFDGMRYHSLAIDPATLPTCLRVTAQSDEGEIMGVRHNRFPTFGIQFHPESILTPKDVGMQLLRNFLAT